MLAAVAVLEPQNVGMDLRPSCAVETAGDTICKKRARCNRSALVFCRTKTQPSSPTISWYLCQIR